jgi:hypothetical protein
MRIFSNFDEVIFIKFKFVMQQHMLFSYNVRFPESFVVLYRILLESEFLIACNYKYVTDCCYCGININVCIYRINFHLSADTVDFKPV